ncbi:basic proline-rich protein-like [Anser cygnoides]|uniref:basic proline-rich protein-like n=1 Tax=Anser cygnoides TaxID=8845 RepID=UPI0034D216F3
MRRHLHGHPRPPRPAAGGKGAGGARRWGWAGRQDREGREGGRIRPRRCPGRSLADPGLDPGGLPPASARAKPSPPRPPLAGLTPVLFAPRRRPAAPARTNTRTGRQTDRQTHGHRSPPHTCTRSTARPAAAPPERCPLASPLPPPHGRGARPSPSPSLAPQGPRPGHPPGRAGPSQAEPPRSSPSTRTYAASRARRGAAPLRGSGLCCNACEADFQSLTRNSDPPRLPPRAAQPGSSSSSPLSRHSSLQPSFLTLLSPRPRAGTEGGRQGWRQGRQHPGPDRTGPPRLAAPGRQRACEERHNGEGASRGYRFLPARRWHFPPFLPKAPAGNFFVFFFLLLPNKPPGASRGPPGTRGGGSRASRRRSGPGLPPSPSLHRPPPGPPPAAQPSRPAAPRARPRLPRPGGLGWGPGCAAGEAAAARTPKKMRIWGAGAGGPVPVNKERAAWDRTSEKRRPPSWWVASTAAWRQPLLRGLHWGLLCRQAPCPPRSGRAPRHAADLSAETRLQKNLQPNLNARSLSKHKRCASTNAPTYLLPGGGACNFTSL